MSLTKPERTARAMTDQQLADLDKSLCREIPAAQSLQSAVRREVRRRQRAARKAAA